MVQGDVNDIDSLNLAFQGANVIFGVTDFWQPFLEQANYAKLKAGQTINEFCFDLEVQKGKNIAVAAAGVDTLERLVFSLLSNARKWSKGKYTWVYHFDSKARVAEYIAEALPELNKKMSILQVGLFATNWKISLFTPQEVSKIGPAFDTSTLVDTPPSIEVPDRSRPSRQDEADCIVAIGRVVCAESPGRWSQAYAYGSHSQRHWVFCEGTG